MATVVTAETAFGLDTLTLQTECRALLFAHVVIDGVDAPDGTPGAWGAPGAWGSNNPTLNGWSGLNFSSLGAAGPSDWYYIAYTPTGVVSNPVSVTWITTGGCPDYYPSPPVLTATPGNSQVTLNWTASVSTNTHYPVDTYTVRRSTTSGSGYSTTASGVTGLTYTDTTAANGTTYYYIVEPKAAGPWPAHTGGYTSASTSNEASAIPTGVMTVSLDGIRIPLFTILAGYNQIDYGTGY